MSTNIDCPYSPSWLNRLTAWIVGLPGPAWPRQAETLRGFVSALVLPVLIWALTSFPDRFVTF